MQLITPEIHQKLEEIGFEQDEIDAIRIIHELKTGKYVFDMKKLINKIAFQNLSNGITDTFERNKWKEEDFFEIVEKQSGAKRN